MKHVSIILLIFAIFGLPIFAQEVKVSIPDSVGIPGEILTIPIKLNNVNDVSSAEIIVEYNQQILEFLEVNISDSITISWNMVTGFNENQITINIILLPDLSGSTGLVDISFEVKPTAQVGETTFINFVQAKLNDDFIQTQDGKITIEDSNGGSGIPGDVNGDLVVDRQDLLDLIISYRKRSTDNAYKPSADFNNDGNVNRQDLNILIENYGRRD
ncbi:hypothetical protein GF312_22855 [Candidatus Poribacteria bacterium]|nr:hypothetical protein [Candidatus Poribacteria bacterium]